MKDKERAILQVKGWLKQINILTKLDITERDIQVKTSGVPSASDNRTIGRILALVEFFDLTEEDLKDEN